MYFIRHDTPSGRWYERVETEDENGDVKEVLDPFYPSVTTGLSAKPMSYGLYKHFCNAPSMEWVEEDRDEKGHRGTAVHVAASLLCRGYEVSFKDELVWDREAGDGIVLPDYEVPEEKRFVWTKDAIKMLMGIESWIRAVKLCPLAVEFPVFYEGEAVRFAGCCDLMATTSEDQGIGIVDWKTSSQLDISMEWQVADYWKAVESRGLVRVDWAKIVRAYAWRGSPKVQVVALDRAQLEARFQESLHVWHTWQAVNNNPRFTPPEELPERVSVLDILASPATENSNEQAGKDAGDGATTI